MSFRRVMIVADIEGSSGCWNHAASAFLSNQTPRPLTGSGPFDVRVVFREGVEAARKAACRWGLTREGRAMRFTVVDLRELFVVLSRIC